MDWQTLVPVFGLALLLIAAAIASMAVGVMFRRPCLRGSCGGREVRGPDGAAISCSNCPNRKPAAS